MRTRTTYICEVCESQYDTAADALTCEAHGLPAPMPWLHFGERVPAFGEDGVKWTTITGVAWIENRGNGEHVWALRVEPLVSLCSNRGDMVDIAYPSDFDPREGVDAFRYDGTPTDLRVWAERMAELGFAESEASEWVREHVAHWRAVHAKKETGR